MKKISQNIKRDEENYIKLTALGWKIHTLWQCGIEKSELDLLAVQIENTPKNNH